MRAGCTRADVPTRVCQYTTHARLSVPAPISPQHEWASTFFPPVRMCHHGLEVTRYSLQRHLPQYGRPIQPMWVEQQGSQRDTAVFRPSVATRHDARRFITSHQLSAQLRTFLFTSRCCISLLTKNITMYRQSTHNPYIVVATGVTRFVSRPTKGDERNTNAKT
jgi:hypothetical protein